jgi:hypothetical protein
MARRPINFRTTPEMADRLAREAEQVKRSRSEYLHMILEALSASSRPLLRTAEKKGKRKS